MIGKLQYVVHTRSDIALALGIVARFSVKPRENHMTEIKRILGYLKGTEDYGLWYKLGGNIDLKVFTYVDWAKNLDDIKSTTGELSFLVKDWYLGQARSKTTHPNPQQKKNMWQQQ